MRYSDNREFCFKFEAKLNQIEEFTVVNDDVLVNFNDKFVQKYRCMGIS